MQYCWLIKYKYSIWYLSGILGFPVIGNFDQKKRKDKLNAERGSIVQPHAYAVLYVGSGLVDKDLFEI